MRGDGTVFQVHGCGAKTEDDTYPCGKSACPTGRWHAKLVVNGKRVHRSAKTRAEVLSKLRGLRSAKEAGRSVAGRQPTVEQWISHWLTEIAPAAKGGRASEGTIDDYWSYAKAWIFPEIGTVRIDRLTVAQVRGVVNAPRAAGRSGSTCRHIHAILRRSLRVAMQEKGLTHNVAAVIDGPSLDAQPIDPPTRADARRLLKCTSDLARNGARWVVALALGMRQGEVLGLCWPDVDLEQRTITITWSLKRRRGKHGCGDPYEAVTDNGLEMTHPCRQKQAARCPSSTRAAGLFLKPPKSQASRRTIALPAEVAAELRRHRAAQLQERIATRGWKPWDAPIEGGPSRPVELVFAQPNGKPIDPRRDWTEWKELLATAGVPDARVHDARHTAATVLLEMGVDVKVVSAILGHSSTSLTQNTYQHLVPDIADAAADATSTALWGEEQPARSRRRKVQ